MSSDRSFEKTAMDKLTFKKNTPKEIATVIRVVCGADSCRDAQDAKFLLNVMGIDVRTVPCVGV